MIEQKENCDVRNTLLKIMNMDLTLTKDKSHWKQNF